MDTTGKRAGLAPWRRCGGRAPRDGGAEPVEVFELTSGLTGRTHLVPVTAVEEAITNDRSWFQALCGLQVVAASLASPPGAACFACRDSGVAWRHVGAREAQR